MRLRGPANTALVATLAFALGCGGQASQAAADASDLAADSGSRDAQTSPADGGTPADSGCPDLLAAAGLRCGPEPVRVAWIGAHPDDEAWVAPLLAELCHLPQVSCEILVATRGEGGSCLLDGGCQPDLGTVRAEEMRKAAALLNAQLTQWALPNGGPRPATPEGVTGYWAQLRGSEQILVGELAAELRRMAPDLLFSFDPRHGDTCHEEHRALGGLVLAAVDTLESKPQAFFFPAGAKAPATTSIGYRAVCSDPAIEVYDATRLLPSTQRQAWDSLVELMLLHRSQFDPSYAAMASRAPPEFRIVPLLPRSAYVPAAECYSSVCP